MIPALWRVVAAVKNAMVTDTKRYVTVKSGIARGAVLFTSYRHGARALLGLYESELRPYVRRYVRPGDVCFDIGGGDGYYTFAFARLAAPGRVYAVEGDPRSTATLQRLAGENRHLGSAVTVRCGMVGAVHANRDHVSVDGLIAEHHWPTPSVIKVDVEGAELDVLSGASRLLREHHPRLIIEVHSAELEAHCDTLLKTLGYTTIIVANRAWMAEDAFRQGHNRWLCAE